MAWVWVDGTGALTNRKHKTFYDVLAVNSTPFSEFATETYGVIKGFARTGRWKDSNGDGFLAWYTEPAIDSIEKERGLALVYTHLDRKWIDPEIRQIREPIGILFAVTFNYLNLLEGEKTSSLAYKVLFKTGFS
ncbi:MAG: hypothetical protein JRE64_01030 [Deltaproteobacteria bacterium]|nr:hypothetical protein [Deltaproteobacteria bacterium]